jgi:hypothetical protein
MYWIEILRKTGENTSETGGRVFKIRVFRILLYFDPRLLDRGAIPGCILDGRKWRSTVVTRRSRKHALYIRLKSAF